MPLITGEMSFKGDTPITDEEAATIFKKLKKSPYQDYADKIKEKRLNEAAIAALFRDNPNPERSIGSIGATSCINVCYLNSRHIAVHHHDYEGRDRESIRQIFENRFLKSSSEDIYVTLIGGFKETNPEKLRKNDENSYEGLHTHVLEIFLKTYFLFGKV